MVTFFSGGATESAADAVRTQKARLDRGRVLGGDFRLDPDY